LTTWFTLPTKVVYGDRAVREIGPIASSAAFRHAMIVTDSGVRRAGLADVVAESLRQAGVVTTIYDRVSSNPRSVECSAGAEAMSKAGIDLVVAVGGGSAVDAAKAMALLVTNGGQVQDYIPSLGGQVVAEPMLPLYAVPTTCGTGAEVSPTAIITITGNRQKVTLKPCPPAIAFVDPMLALSMPAHLAASTGIDALSHAVEAFISPNASPYTDLFAVQAIRMIAANLRDAVRATGEPRHDPMSAMMYAANLAGFSLRAGTGQVHSLGHALGGVLDIPHGQAMAVLLSAVLRYHLDYLAPRLAELAQLMGQNTFGLSERLAAERAVDAISRLREDVGLPGRLVDVGVGEEHLVPLTDVVMLPDEAQRRNRPRPCTREDVLAMYHLALTP